MVNSRYPGFSWVDPNTVVHQTGYQLWLATGKADVLKNSAACWSSGKVQSDLNINVLYTGPALKPGTIYYWKVKVWDADNKMSAYSTVQAFKTGDKQTLSDYKLPSFVLTKSLQLPATARAFSKGQILYDFGRDAFGQPVLKINALKDDRISIRLGEKLDTAGHIDTLPPGTVRYRQINLPLQKGTHSYSIVIPPDKRNTGQNAIKMPAYIGEVLPFRYIEILGDLRQNDILEAKRAMVNMAFDDTSTRFESSDTILNKVWELCKYTIKATSFTGYYVDGDRERIPYEADALINQLSQYSVDDAFNMAKRTLDYLIYHPTWPTEWSLQNPLIAYYDYMYSGDARNLGQIYTELTYKALTALQEKNGLISTRTGKQLPAFLKSIHYKVFNGNEGLQDIVDWPHTEKETDGFVFTDYNAVVNAFYYGSLQALAGIASDLHKPAAAAGYRQRALAVKKAFTDNFINPETGLVRDGIGTDHSSLHANMFAMAFGLVPAANTRKVLDFIQSRGVSCSVYGAQFLLDALGQKDTSDYALQLLTAAGQRSWMNMLREGSTMTMEAWGQAFKPNQDWNHAWGTAPANYIVRYLMGIRPVKPGFKEVAIKPHPAGLKKSSDKI